MRNKKSIITLICAAALIAALFAACAAPAEESAGTKTITLTVIANDTTEEFTFDTAAATLADALTAEGLIEGEDSSYGLFITTVNGITADDSKEEWWMLSVDGESAQTGADGIEIEDSGKYELTLMAGY